MKKNSFGYTLIELLIVISVIAILAGTFVWFYPKYLARSRDDVRKNDLRVYAVSLEKYADGHSGYYPAFLANHNVDLMCVGSILNEPACQNDPLYNNDQSKPHYHYMSNGGPDGTANATRWVLSATLEEKYDGVSYLWVACSDGRSGRVLPPEWFPNGVCPANLLQ